MIVGKPKAPKVSGANLRRQEAGTPRLLFYQLQEEYHFTVDVCAVAHNAKLLPFVTPEQNALSMDWGCLPLSKICYWDAWRVWCNPPYDDIPRWLAHALEPEISVYLLPARTDREWFRRWKPLAEVHWFVGEKPHKRLQFEPPPGLQYSSNPDCHLLMCFGEGFVPGLERWRSGRTYELLPTT
jgi:hypothetical protein